MTLISLGTPGPESGFKRPPGLAPPVKVATVNPGGWGKVLGTFAVGDVDVLCVHETWLLPPALPKTHCQVKELGYDAVFVWWASMDNQPSCLRMPCRHGGPPCLLEHGVPTDTLCHVGRTVATHQMWPPDELSQRTGLALSLQTGLAVRSVVCSPLHSRRSPMITLVRCPCKQWLMRCPYGH